MPDNKFTEISLVILKRLGDLEDILITLSLDNDERTANISKITNQNLTDLDDKEKTSLLKSCLFLIQTEKTIEDLPWMSEEMRAKLCEVGNICPQCHRREDQLAQCFTCHGSGNYVDPAQS